MYCLASDLKLQHVLLRPFTHEAAPCSVFRGLIPINQNQQIIRRFETSSLVSCIFLSYNTRKVGPG